MNRRQRAFTIIELLIALVLVVILLGLAAPSFREFIEVQRLRAVNAELVTDVQYARSEAISRGRQVAVQFHRATDAEPMTCYTIYTSTTNAIAACNCTDSNKATRCAADTTELKNVQLEPAKGVSLQLPTTQGDTLVFDPEVSGSPMIPPIGTWGPLPTTFLVDTLLDDNRKLRVIVGVSGRPTVCRPTTTVISGGYSACP